MDIKVTHFDGRTYDHSKDYIRIKGQMLRVYAVVKDGRWRTLNQISQECGDPEASISARLRDLRKERFGSHEVERQRLQDGGTYAYRLATSE